MYTQPSIDINSTISQFFKRPDTTSGTLQTLDYTSTRFHNALVGKQNHSTIVSEAYEAQQRQRAYEKAKEEVSKRGQEEAEKQRKKDLDEQKAKMRGNAALQKERNKQ